MRTIISLVLTTLILQTLLFDAAKLQSQSSSDRGAISGTVKEKKTSEGLPGVNVVLDGTTLGAATDLQGSFIIRAVPPGTYRVRASIIGYLPEVKSAVRVNARETAQIDFRLNETTIDVPEVIVTASKKAQSFMETPASVSVVGSRQIERQKAVTLDEVLQFIPGVNLMSGQVNIRGSSGYSRGAGTRVQFLVDGVPMLPGDSGDIKWDALSPHEIDHVEVVKGASSSLYGSNAMGGVLNVITKEPSEVPVTTIQTTYGIYDEPYYSEWDWTDRTLTYNNQDISHSRSFGELKWRGSIGRRESTGYGENRQYHRWNGYTKAKYNLSTTSFVTLYANYARDRHGEVITWKSENDVFEVATDETGLVTTSTKLQLGGTYRTLLNRRMTLKLRESFYRNGFDNEVADPGENPFCATDSDTVHVRANKNEIEAQLDVEFNERHSSTLGGALALNDIDATLYGSHTSRGAAAYLQHEWRPNVLLSATGSLRFDYYWVDTGLIEYHLNPRLGLVYQLSPRVSVRASSGRGFRAATMAELFTCTRAGGFTVIPNPDLSSEIAWSHEIGAQFIASAFLINSALFWSDYEDLIEGDFVIKQSKSVIQFQNFNRARIRGAELELNGSLWKRRINFVGSYTYLDARELERRNSRTGAIEEVDNPLAYRAKHLLSGNITLNLGRFSLGADSRYVSRIEEVRVYPADPRVSQKITNLRLGVDFKPVEFTLNVNNVFHYTYTQVERTIEPIRNITLSTALVF